MNYSEDYLIKLVNNKPEELVKLLLNPKCAPKDLMIGVEILANECKNEENILPVLRRLLKHVNANVRESAVIGIISFYVAKSPPQDILDRVAEIANSDPSQYLREYARDSLSKY